VRISHDDDDALLEVTDTGRGIAPVFLPHVFEMFKQADAVTTRGEGGLGIGLALVKSLAELHGGRVAAESEGKGRGATFKVWLPLHERTDLVALDEEPAVPQRSLGGIRVLLVDDHARYPGDLRLPARVRRRCRHAGGERRRSLAPGRGE